MGTVLLLSTNEVSGAFKRTHHRSCTLDSGGSFHLTDRMPLCLSVNVESYCSINVIHAKWRKLTSNGDSHNVS